MFIDYVTLMLINMSAGLAILAWYVAKGLDDPDQPRWAPAFAVSGLIALASGLRMSWTWPLPGSYNAAFGDTSALFGALLLGTAWSVAAKRDLMPLAAYAFFAGLAGVLAGAATAVMGLTKFPILTSIGFILTGSAGVLAGATLYWRKNATVRTIGALVLLAAAAIWAFNGYAGYWAHLSMFSKWMPR